MDLEAAVRAFQLAVEIGDADGVRRGWEPFLLHDAGQQKKYEHKLLLPHLSPDVLCQLAEGDLWQTVPLCADGAAKDDPVEQALARGSEEVEVLDAVRPLAVVYPKNSYAHPIEYLMARYLCDKGPSWRVDAYHRALLQTLQCARQHAPSMALYVSNLRLACGAPVPGYHNPSITLKALHADMDQERVVRLLRRTAVKDPRVEWPQPTSFWLTCFLSGHYRTQGEIMRYIVQHRLTAACAVRALHEMARRAMRRTMREFESVDAVLPELVWLLAQVPPSHLDDCVMPRVQHTSWLAPALPEELLPRSFGLLHECVLRYVACERFQSHRMLRTLLEEAGLDPYTVDSNGRTAAEALRALRAEDVMTHFR